MLGYCLVFFPRCKTSANMAFLFIYFEYISDLREKLGVLRFQAFAYILMYGCIKREQRKIGVLRILLYYYIAASDECQQTY